MRKTSFAAYVSTLKRDDNSIWKPIKTMKKPQTPLPPIRKNSVPQGPWTKRDKEKVELFAAHLSVVFTPHENIQDPEVESDIATHTQPTENLQALILREIKNKIKNLNPHRAPGFDLITAQMLKELPHEGYLNLLYILNAIRRLEYWPTPLKQTKIIMILKPGINHTDFSYN
jgi:hypothetical protein